MEGEEAIADAVAGDEAENTEAMEEEEAIADAVAGDEAENTEHFESGTHIELFGLTSAEGQRLNGKHGTILQGPMESGRYEIRLEVIIKHKAVKPENLRRWTPEFRNCFMKDWGLLQVGTWLESIGMQQYVRRFYDEYVGGAVCIHFDLTGLEYLDVLPEDRIPILNAISNFSVTPDIDLTQ
jgi:hypothetical protein